MARPLRLQYEGGIYHVINRGNYRSALFRAERTKAAFLECLGETCTKTGWRIHAWCIMSNHFHLAVETPRGNLAEGMRWLQGTFATRFNRMRRVQGHLFQGRYKSLIVESGEYLGALCHYINLNPVRAGLCSVQDLVDWKWCSVRWLRNPKQRPKWFDPTDALQRAGGLRDTPAGRRKYLDYLDWLQEEEPARKQLQFEKMSKGWTIGSTEFRKALIKENRDLVAQRALGADVEMAEAQEQAHQELLDQLLHRLGQTRRSMAAAGKFESWKVALAAAMKARTTVTNRWLSNNLAMGSLHEVSRQVSNWKRNPDRKLAKRLR